MSIKVYIDYQEYTRKLCLYVFMEHPNGQRSLCVDLNMMEFSEPIDDNVVIDKPTLTLNDMVARPLLQCIVNEAKKIGIVADKTPVLENELTATKYHLEDMRQLVFKAVNIDL